MILRFQPPGSMISRKQAHDIVQGQAAALERADRMQQWAIGAMEMAPDEAQARAPPPPGARLDHHDHLHHHLLRRRRRRRHHPNTTTPLHQAHLVLSLSIHENKHYSALDIAMHTQAHAQRLIPDADTEANPGRWPHPDPILNPEQAKAFLTQRHCQSLTDKWWRGGTAGSSVQLPVDFSWLFLCLFAFVPVINPHLYAETLRRAELERSKLISSSLGSHAEQPQNVRRLPAHPCATRPTTTTTTRRIRFLGSAPPT